MNNCRLAYEYYKQASKEHGLEAINVHYFILNLSQEQLDTYNELAQKRGRDEVAG